MPVEIRVPQLGESVLEAVVARWLKQAGEPVAIGDPLVELETEKVNQEIYADQAGVLGAVLKEAGETVGVGELIGSLDVSGAPANAPASGAAAKVAASAKVPAPAAPAQTWPAESAAPVTPVARRLAGETGIDLAGVQGTGPGGGSPKVMSRPRSIAAPRLARMWSPRRRPLLQVWSEYRRRPPRSPARSQLLESSASACRGGARLSRAGWWRLSRRRQCSLPSTKWT